MAKRAAKTTEPPKKKEPAKVTKVTKPAKQPAAKKAQAKKAVAAAAPTLPKSAKTSGMASSDSLLSYVTDAAWKAALKPEAGKPYFKELEKLVLAAYASTEVFPEKSLIFNALNLTPLNKVKVVIIGQDPYHDVGQAHGLSFSVPHGVRQPPSLKNIFKELANHCAYTPDHGCLEGWARGGVLLLNATLTVEAHKPNSHAKFGWQTFTDAIIKTVNDQTDGVAFILWGNFAHKKEKLISASKHCVIKTAHPSPLSFKLFLNCGCFIQANDALKKFGKKPVDWALK